MKYKVQEISIPRLKNDYLTDYRHVRFENEKDWTYMALDCFKGCSELYLGENVDAEIKSMRDYNPMLLVKEGWCYFEYICVSGHNDGPKDDGVQYYIYDFYREGEKDEGVPYSQVFVRSKELFDVGESYVICYKKVE